MVALAAVIPVATMILNQFGTGVPWTYVAILCLVASFWMARSASFIAGVGLAVACGAMVAVVGGVMSVRLTGTYSAHSPFSVLIGMTLVGVVSGFIGACAAIALTTVIGATTNPRRIIRRHD